MQYFFLFLTDKERLFETKAMTFEKDLKLNYRNWFVKDFFLLSV